MAAEVVLSSEMSDENTDSLASLDEYENDVTPVALIKREIAFLQYASKELSEMIGSSARDCFYGVLELNNSIKKVLQKRKCSLRDLEKAGLAEATGADSQAKDPLASNA